jgi:hypothetical protein
MTRFAFIARYPNSSVERVMRRVPYAEVETITGGIVGDDPSATRLAMALAAEHALDKRALLEEWAPASSRPTAVRTALSSRRSASDRRSAR